MLNARCDLQGINYIEGNKGVKYEPFILYKLQLVHHQEIVGLHDL